MKKRILCLALLLAVAFSALTGCLPQETEGNSAETSETSSAGTSAAESESDTSSGDAGVTEEPEDFFTENGHGFLPETAELPALCEETRTEHLYELPLELPELKSAGLPEEDEDPNLWFRFGSKTIHVAYTDTNRFYRVLSAENGKLLTEQKLPYKGNAGALADDRFWIVNYDGLTVDFYDQNGNKTSVLKSDNAYKGSFMPSYAAVSPDGKTVLAGFDGGTPFLMFDIETGDKTRVTPEGKAEEWTLLAQTDSVFLFAGDRGSLLQINTSDKTYKQIVAEDPVDDVSGSLYRLADIETGLILRGESDGETAMFIASFESENESALEYGYGCCATSDDGVIRFYDLREGKQIAKFTLGERYYDLHADFTEDGAAFITATYWGEPVCFIYDLPAAKKDTSGEVTVTTGVYEVSGLEGIVQEWADTVADQYGIEIYCGSEGNDFIIDGYVAVAEKDPIFLYNSLQTIDRILARYPEGMIREIYEGYKGMQFYLCGSIYGYGDGGLDQAGGFTTDWNNYIVIVLDLYNGLETTLPHELSHACDRQIEYQAAVSGINWSALWESVTPYADAYLYTYADYYYEDDYTVYGETKDANIWFTDSYGRTYPTEDRARLMECMFADESDHMSRYLDYENLEYKAKLYCYILRQCFDSCNTEEELYWERNLGIPSADEFEDLLGQ